MLTTDVALKADPIYRQYVEEFANDENAFAEAFAKVWFELTTRDMGPASRCTSDDVPSPQSFQHPLPEPPKKVSNMDKVEKALLKMMKQNGNGEFVRLAWQCASTFRITDYHGGCNGARIRFSPGKDWETNDGLGDTLALLQPIKDQFKALKLCFLTHRQIGASEAVYRVLPGFHLRDSNVGCIFVITGFPEKRNLLRDL